MKEVLQKYLAAAGLGSRRQVEKLILEGRVKVNGKIAKLGDRADEHDEVLVNNQKISGQAAKIYIKLNKPVGYVCTNRVFKGEKNIFSLVPIKERLFVVGRLDKDSRGLVLLTNDGEWANKLTHPRYEGQKVYEVVIDYPQEIATDSLALILSKFKGGINIGEDDGVVWAKNIKYVNYNKFRITLTQGKKRQLRRMFAVLGYKVLDLKRVSLDKYELGDLREGAWAKINK